MKNGTRYGFETTQDYTDFVRGEFSRAMVNLIRAHDAGEYGAKFNALRNAASDALYQVARFNACRSTAQFERLMCAIYEL